VLWCSGSAGEQKAFNLLERTYDLIEMVWAPPGDQFAKYVVVINLARAADAVRGTSYNHILSPFQRQVGASVHISQAEIGQRAGV
jgi:hypothetical protein